MKFRVTYEFEGAQGYPMYFELTVERESEEEFLKAIAWDMESVTGWVLFAGRRTIMPARRLVSVRWEQA